VSRSGNFQEEFPFHQAKGINAGARLAIKTWKQDIINDSSTVTPKNASTELFQPIQNINPPKNYGIQVATVCHRSSVYRVVFPVSFSLGFF